MSKASDARAWAEQRVGCPYIYGATGKTCTVSYREARAAQYPEYADKIRKNCPRLSKNVSTCADCKWCDPETGAGKLAYDCAQLVRWCMHSVGIEMVSGANSQWQKTDWAQTGTIDTLPKDKLCLVYREDTDGKKHHTGIYCGNGKIIHAKGHDYGVVQQDLGVPKFTHWGIPRGLYDIGGGTDMKPTWPTLRYGDSGLFVIILQGLLAANGLGIGKSGLLSTGVDGKFGGKTQNAVKEYQAMTGQNITGVCGSATWNSLLEREAAPSLDGYLVMSLEDGKALRDAITNAKALIDKANWE